VTHALLERKVRPLLGSLARSWDALCMELTRRSPSKGTFSSGTTLLSGSKRFDRDLQVRRGLCSGTGAGAAATVAGGAAAAATVAVGVAAFAGGLLKSGMCKELASVSRLARLCSR